MFFLEDLILKPKWLLLPPSPHTVWIFLCKIRMGSREGEKGRINSCEWDQRGEQGMGGRGRWRQTSTCLLAVRDLEPAVCIWWGSLRLPCCFPACGELQQVGYCLSCLLPSPAKLWLHNCHRHSLPSPSSSFLLESLISKRTWESCSHCLYALPSQWQDLASWWSQETTGCD